MVGWAVSADVDGVVVTLDPAEVELAPDDVTVPGGDPLVGVDGFASFDPGVDEPSAEGSMTRADAGAPSSSAADDDTVDPWAAVVGIGQVELVPASMVASEPPAVSSGELQAAAIASTAARPSVDRRNGLDR